MIQHIAENQDALLDYLYEEGDPAERLKVAQHLQDCAECSVAVLELQNVRGMLGGWTPPASELGFRIVQDPDISPSARVDRGARSGWWRGWVPATSQGMPWLHAAAAVLLFVAGMAVSQLNVTYADGKLIVSTESADREANPRDTSITLPAQTVNAAAATGSLDLDAIERELRARLEARTASADETERLLQRVRAMIDQSEQRQQRELALRLSQVASEVDTQHQADLLKIQQDFGEQQRATMEYLVRTSGGVK